MKKLNNFLLYSNIYKDEALCVANEVKSRITIKGGEACICSKDDILAASKENGFDLDKVDCIIVLGGDGTLIRACHTIGERFIPMIGVNLGTVGFLTEVDLPKIDEMITRLMNGDYSIEKRMMLEGMVRLKKVNRGLKDLVHDDVDNVDRETFNDLADVDKEVTCDGELEALSNEKADSASSFRFNSLNDVVLARSGALRLIAIKIYVNDKFFDTYEADGVIVSTPTGSTGYNMSAGGPIISPKASLILVTPICPHSLSKKSVVFSAEDEIKLELIEKRKTQINEALVSFDGFMDYEIGVNSSVTVRRSEQELDLIKLDEESFYEVLSRKFTV